MPLVSTSYLSFVPRGVFFWVVKRKEGALQHLDRVDLPGGRETETVVTGDSGGVGRSEPAEEQRGHGVQTPRGDIFSHLPLPTPRVCSLCPFPLQYSSQCQGLSGSSQVSLRELLVALSPLTALASEPGPTHFIFPSSLPA